MTDNSHYVRLTPEQLAELRELEKQATPGPWRDSSGAIMVACDYREDCARCIAQACSNDPLPDSALIVAMRNALRSLLDELESLRAEVERLRRVRDAAEAVGRGLAAGEVFAEDLAAVNLQAALAATKEQP